ncbi:MAG: hypothetical protein F6J97_20555, partial [Leptolyngbya sp. SIO4C1]|nr:hypothetical protein [Leptolyngbya sp. SIO4C1]
MAREGAVFLRRLQSFLAAGRRKLGARWRLLALGCCTLLLTLMSSLSLSLSVVPQAVVSRPALAQTEAPASPEDWFQTGQRAYETQDYQRAVMALNQAIQGFEAQGQRLPQAIALSNLSLTHQALGAWSAAAQAMDQSFERLDVTRAQLTTASIANFSDAQLRILAPTLEIEGQLRLRQGDAETALESWRLAEQIYHQQQDRRGAIAAQTSQLQALQSLGLYLQANAIAQTLEKQLDQIDEPLLNIRARRSLGETYRAVGRLDPSADYLQQSLAAAEKLAMGPVRSQEISATQLSLGNTYFALGDREQERQASLNRQDTLPWQCLSAEVPNEAQDYYQQADTAYATAIAQAADARQQVAARLNQLAVLLELEGNNAFLEPQWTAISGLLSGQAFRDRFGVYARIKLAKQGACLKQRAANESLDWEPIIAQLKQASTIAAALNDPVAISQSLGNLGGLYEYFSWLETSSTKALNENTWHQAAQMLTEQALLAAQPSELPDIAYQWQWQLARLHKAVGQIETAVNDYRRAVDTLRAVRNNLLTIDSEVQFSFRDNVEPVYRELADLLLRAEVPSQAALKEVVGLIDNIQLAELESFLQCNLVGTVELTE